MQTTPIYSRRVCVPCPVLQRPQLALQCGRFHAGGGAQAHTDHSCPRIACRLLCSPVQVYFVEPDCDTPEKIKQLHPEFSTERDFVYSAYTVRRHMVLQAVRIALPC